MACWLGSPTWHGTAETMPSSSTRRPVAPASAKASERRSSPSSSKHAKAAGCEWLHVDFDPGLAPFYFDACGFECTDAGLIHLASEK